MAAEGGHGPQTSSEYISHHLQNLQVCKSETGEWIWNHCAGNPMAINVDSMFWSIFLGLVFVFFFHKVARKSSTDKPGKWQAFVEIIVEFVDSSVKDTFHGTSRLIAPLGLSAAAGAVYAGWRYREATGLSAESESQAEQASLLSVERGQVGQVVWVGS